MLFPLIQSLRPKQWTKNLLLFAGLVFSEKLFFFPSVLKSIFAFLIFCLISGGLYLVNDLKDLEKDREHPQKKNRPIASGRVSIPVVRISAVVLLTGMTVTAFMLSVPFGWVALSYLLLILFYSYGLKNLVILDVLVISIGFVLRAVAGAVVIGVSISSWLLVCTIFLALFLSLNKRRHELAFLGEKAIVHRKILSEYSPSLLDLMITMVSACVLMSYALYTTADETVEKFGTRDLIFTLPFVIYGIFRYLYLAHQKGKGGSPELVLLQDRELIIDILLWIGMTLAVIYYKKVLNGLF